MCRHYYLYVSHLPLPIISAPWSAWDSFESVSSLFSIFSHFFALLFCWYLARSHRLFTFLILVDTFHRAYSPITHNLKNPAAIPMHVKRMWNRDRNSAAVAQTIYCVCVPFSAYSIISSEDLQCNNNKQKFQSKSSLTSFHNNSQQQHRTHRIYKWYVNARASHLKIRKK